MRKRAPLWVFAGLLAGALVLGLAAGGLAQQVPPAPAPQVQAPPPPKVDTGDNAWMLASSALVLLMTIPGLALFYGGLVRAKNALSVLMQCFSIACAVTIVWVVAGYSIAFGDGGKLSFTSEIQQWSGQHGGPSIDAIAHIGRDGFLFGHVDAAAAGRRRAGVVDQQVVAVDLAACLDGDGLVEAVGGDRVLVDAGPERADGLPHALHILIVIRVIEFSEVYAYRIVFYIGHVTVNHRLAVHRFNAKKIRQRPLEMTGVLMDLEAHHVTGQQAVQHLISPVLGNQLQQFISGEGNVQEEAAVHRLQAILQESRQQHQVIIVYPNQVAFRRHLAHLLREGVEQARVVVDGILAARAQALAMMPNADAGGERIREQLAAYAGHRDVRVVTHLPRERYLSWLARADALVIVAPEYNHGYPGLLKHLLDSCLKEYIHKAVGIVGVSSGPFGGSRVIFNLLPVMRELGLVTIFWDVNFSNVHQVFDENGTLRDDAFVRRIDKFLKELIWMAKTLRCGRDNIQLA